MRRSRLSRSMLLIKHFFDNNPGLHEAAKLLSDAHDAVPDAVNTILVQPWVAVWTVQSARDPSRPEHGEAAKAVALAAAEKAGLAHRGLTFFPRNGAAVFPGLGRLAISRPTRLTPADLHGPRWEDTRSVASEVNDIRIRLSVEDLDACRDCHDAPVSGRLTETEISNLQHTLDNAWRLLVTSSPRRALEVGTGMVSLVPLRNDAPGSWRSATNADAFGGFAATLHDDPAELAATLVHEFQHAKMCALTSLVPIYQSTGDDHFAPWRQDSRPLGGLIQGTYAFTAVAGFWRDLRRSPQWRVEATKRFALTRAQVWRAARDLAKARGLTPAGRRFVQELGRTIKDLAQIAVPRSVQSQADAEVALAEAAWAGRAGLDGLK